MKLAVLSTLSLATSLLFAACDGSHSHCHTDECAPPDAPVDGPGSTSSVEEVTCPASPAATITTSGFAYSPSAATISVNDVVKFEMPGSHDAKSGVPGSATTDFYVDFGATKCLKFTQAGAFPFFCQPHGFTGAITVQ